MKIMASGSITSWKIEGGKVEAMTNFIFLGSKIIADSDCSHEIQRCLLLGRKTMTNLDSILKSRDITANKGPQSQSYGFSSSQVWMWELDHKECWTPKNWCFWIVVLEKTLESPLGLLGDQIIQSQRKSTLDIHQKDWCWSWSFNTLAHLMRRANSLEKTLMLGKIEGRRRRGWQRMRWLDNITKSMDRHEFEQTQGDGEGQGRLVCCSP